MAATIFCRCWTCGRDVFASPGWRTTGTEAAHFSVTPPGWTGEAPSGTTRIARPRPMSGSSDGRKTNGPADYEAVHKIQAGYKITPLSEWGKTPHAA